MTDREKIIDANSISCKIATEVAETEEEFIFTTISDFIELKTERRISKKELIKAIKAYREYRWHDLRKDPADLPPEQCEVLTKITDSLNQYVHYETSWVIDGDTWVNYFGKPIAWRYIEPFKEET